MSVWKEIDEMKAKFDNEFSELKSYVYNVNKRAGNSVQLRSDGRLRLRFDDMELVAMSAPALLVAFKEAVADRDRREKKPAPAGIAL